MTGVKDESIIHYTLKTCIYIRTDIHFIIKFFQIIKKYTNNIRHCLKYNVYKKSRISRILGNRSIAGLTSIALVK